MTALLVGWTGACSDDSVCEPVLGHRFDLVEQCYEAPVELAGLRACRTRTEKGMGADCVASPDGELFMATRNIAASFEGSGWRQGGALSADEIATCTRAVRELGFPGGSAICATTDAGP